MPEIIFKAPDGKRYRVNAKPGDTETDILREWRKSQIAKREPESWHEDFAEGMGLSGLETAYGVKDFFSDLDEDEQSRLEDWRQDAGQSGWGTAGRVAGEIAQLALPAGLLVKSLRSAGKAKKAIQAGGNAARKVRGLTRAAGDTTAAVGLGATQVPDIGETRRGNAIDYGAGAVAGETGGYLLGKTIRGLNKTPAAETLLKRGVELTPGQAAEGGTMRGIEGVLDVLPLISPTVRKSRREAVEQMQDVALRAGTPPGGKVTKRGTDAIQELKQGFDDAYSDAWSGATSISNESKKRFVDTLVSGAKNLPKAQRRSLKKVAEDFKGLTTDVTPSKLKALDNDLRKRIASAKNDYDYQTLLAELRKTLRAGAPEDVMEKLSAVDKQYGKYKVLRRAAKNAAEEGGEFTPKQLMQGVKTVGKDAAGEGSAPMQPLATAMTKVAKQADDPAPLETWRRLAGLGPSIPGAKYPGRAVLGRTAAQRAATKAADAIPEYLKRPGLAGATATNEDENWWRYWK